MALQTDPVEQSCFIYMLYPGDVFIDLRGIVSGRQNTRFVEIKLSLRQVFSGTLIPTDRFFDAEYLSSRSTIGKPFRFATRPLQSNWMVDDIPLIDGEFGSIGFIVDRSHHCLNKSLFASFFVDLDKWLRRIPQAISRHCVSAYFDMIRMRPVERFYRSVWTYGRTEVSTPGFHFQGILKSAWIKELQEFLAVGFLFRIVDHGDFDCWAKFEGMAGHVNLNIRPFDGPSLFILNRHLQRRLTVLFNPFIGIVEPVCIGSRRSN